MYHSLRLNEFFLLVFDASNWDVLPLLPLAYGNSFTFGKNWIMMRLSGLNIRGSTIKLSVRALYLNFQFKDNFIARN